MSVGLFLRDKPVKLFVLLRDGGAWHVSGLAKASGTSFFHASNLLEKLAVDGLVVFEVKGKFKFVKLTERGLQLANLLGELNVKFKKEAKKEAKKPEVKEVVAVEQKPEAQPAQQPAPLPPPSNQPVEAKNK